MVNIRSRGSWGARRSDGDRTLSGQAAEVFLHHTVTAHLSPSASVAAEQAQMRSLESIGQNRFGRGISYNVIIFPSGRAYQGVSWNRRGTHTGGRNSTARSICFAGNYETNRPTAAQLATAAAIFQEGRGKWWRSNAPVRGHRDVSATSCPGRYVYSQRGAIRGGTAGDGAAPAPGGSTYKVVGPSEALGPFDKDGDGRTRIADWQRDALGYTGKKADGYFGPDTEEDTKALQQQVGLTGRDVDGMVGPTTLAAWEKAGKPKLKAAPKSPSKPKGKVPGPGHTFPLPSGAYFGPKSGPNRSYSGFHNRSVGGKTDRQWIKEWATQLGRRGWSVGKGKTWLSRSGNDGLWGNEYAALCKAFQRDQGLTVDGLAGKATWDAAFQNPIT